MRVLQIVHGYPPEFIAGTERYCEAVSQWLLERRHECAILAGSDQSAPTATLAAVEQEGLLVARYLRAARRPRRWTEEYDPEAEGLARQMLKLMRPDVVHLHHWQRLTNNLVAICSDLAIPVVVTLHEVWTSCPRVHRIRWDKAFCEEPPTIAPCLTCAERGHWQGDREIRNALALRREIMDTELALATSIIAPSEAHHTFLCKLLGLEGDRFIVLPHGSVPTIALRPRRRTGSQFPRRPLEIGHWGYLMYPKGTHLLLEAVRLLRDPSAVELHLIGTPSDHEYECWLRELSEGITVRFHGAYMPEELLGFDLDLAIFPSITCESYSFTLDEAFRLRLPVIVSDRGALPERIGGAGLKFRAGDAADLAKQIQAVLDSPDLLVRMRRNIRPGNLVSMEAHVAMLEKIYEDAAHAKKLNKKLKRKSPAPHLKLVAHAQQQVIDREEALAGLQQQLASAQARLQEQEAAHAAEAQARRAAEAHRAELEARLAALDATAAALAQERAAEAQARLLIEQRAEELATQLVSVEDAHSVKVQELERAMGALAADRDSLVRRLVEFEQTPAARLQALVVARLTRTRR
jgi:glycosyltransferase involved in cell wall biosynthesis